MTALLPSLTVVIPAYNEEGSLEKVVRAVQSVAGEITRIFEIIIINDGSRDRTREIAERLAGDDPRIRIINHPFNLGFGAAQKSGFGHALYEFVTLVPADDQFDAECLKKFVPLMADADCVVGYRIKRGDPVHRRINTRIFRWVMWFLFGVKLRDINWIKLFRRKILDGIEITFRGIGVDAEVVVKAMRKGCRFREVEVSYRPRLVGVSTGDRPLNVLITVIELLVLWYRLHIARKKVVDGD
jgi:glycosyltransferase involved in cell wall biosynthesis